MKRHPAAVLLLIVVISGAVIVQGQPAYTCARYYQHTAAADWSCSILASAYGIQTAALEQLNPTLDCSRILPRNTLICVQGVTPGVAATPPPVDTSATLLAAGSVPQTPAPATPDVLPPNQASPSSGLETPQQLPAGSSSSSGCQVQLKRWDQCGGSICGAEVAAQQLGGVCGDQPWTVHCCPAQHTCRRIEATYYQCRPDAPAQLLLSVPSHDVKLGEPASVTATLTQGGEPLRNQAVTVSLTNDDTGAVDTYPATTDVNGIAQVTVKSSATPVMYSVSASSGTGADAVSGTWASMDDRDDITWVQEQLVVRVSSNSSAAASSTSNPLVLANTEPAIVQVTYTVNGDPKPDAVVTIMLVTAAAAGGNSAVVDTTTARTNDSGIAMAAFNSPRGFLNVSMYVNATVPSILGDGVVIATAPAPPAAAQAAAAPGQPLAVIWIPPPPPKSRDTTAAAAAATVAAPADQTDTGSGTNSPAKTVTLPIARVDVTVSGVCSPAVQNALIVSIRNALMMKLATAAGAPAAAASYIDKVAVTGTCAEGTAKTPADDTPLRRRHLRLLLQATPAAAAAAATYSISIDAAPTVTDGATIQLMLDVFSSFVDQINSDGLATAVPDAAAAVAEAAGSATSVKSAGAIYGYETRLIDPLTGALIPTTTPKPQPATTTTPQPSNSPTIPEQTQPNNTVNSSTAAAVPSPAPLAVAAAAAAVYQPTLKFTFSTSGDCNDAVSDAVVAVIKKKLPASQRNLVKFALMGCSVTPQTGVTPAPGQATPVWAYYQHDVYVSDSVTDPAVLRSLTATFKQFADAVKDAAGLEAAAPGVAAAVAAASKDTAKLVNASAKLKLEPVAAADTAAADPAAVVPSPSPAAVAAAAAVKPVQIMRPSVTLTVVTSGSSGCDAAVSDAMTGSVKDQIPADLRGSVVINETACTEAPKPLGTSKTTATYTITVATAPTLTNATKINSLMETFSTLSDAVNSVGLEMAVPGVAAAVAAASGDTAEVTRADATLDMKVVTLPAAAAAASPPPTTTTASFMSVDSPATNPKPASSSSSVGPAASPSPAYDDGYYDDYGANSTAATNTTAAGQ